jgi:ELWxxDGT repeat protein
MKKTTFWLLLAAIFIASNVNAQTANPANLVNVNGILFYTTTTTAEGTELWKTDGTSAGTVLVKDINPGSNSSNPQYLTPVGPVLYFTADDGVSGIELWKTDGTAAGTVQVKDIKASGSSGIKYLYAYNGILYFSADDGTNGYEPWRSDGTSSGTFILKNIEPVSSSSTFSDPFFKGAGSDVFFRVFVSPGYSQLWKTDGTTTGTVLVYNIQNDFNSLIALGNMLIFESTAGGFGQELWKSDGTAAGTTLLKDINPTNSSWPSDFAVLGTTLYFTADNGTNGYELWKTDGTAAGTIMVSDIYPGSGSGTPAHTVAMNGMIYFASYGNYTTFGDLELWKSDGTAAGTVLVKNINPSDHSYPLYLTPIGNTVYFRAGESTNGFEPWISDGTNAGTVLLKNINPGSNHSQAQSFIAVGTTVYFKADNGNGFELWKTDGTTAGTVMVKDVVAPAIATGTVTSQLCAGTSLNVSYNVTGSYNAGNIFSAQLSDASGSFAAPVTIGTLNTTTSGTVPVTIPSGTPSGTGYRIRVVSSSSVVIGTDNGANITINAAPDAVITAASNSFCSGGSLVMTSTTGTSYIWKKDGTIIAGATSQTYPATAGGSYTVTVTNANGCNTTSAPFVVTVTTVSAFVTAPASFFCQGGSLLLTSSSGDSYQWKINGTGISGGTAQTYNATAAGIYSVLVTTGGCSATSAGYTVTMTPATTITTQPANVIVCQLNPANFSVTANGSGLTYQWQKNSIAITGATNSNYSIASTVPADGGSYDLVVSGTCGNVTSAAAVLTVNICTAVSSINTEPGNAVLMPNVVKTKTSMRISSRSAMKVEFVIYDANGKQVLRLTKQLVAGTNDISLDLQKLASGSYFINGYTAKGKIATLKLIKH